MQHYKELFEFTATLIDIQIKKYKSLAQIGVGPDALLNAQLVCNEVDELLLFAEQLLSSIIKGVPNPLEFQAIIQQVKFYIDVEMTRAYAGWLLDENNIHAPLMGRMKEQTARLDAIAQSASITWATPIEPVTEKQRQCQIDSHFIAYRILDIAHQLRENPELDIALDGLEKQHHAIKIMKAHAQGRYRSYAAEIDAAREACQKFLSRPVSSTTFTFDKIHAKRQEGQHRLHLEALFQSYKKLYPSSALFAATPLYSIGSTEKLPLRYALFARHHPPREKKDAWSLPAPATFQLAFYSRNAAFLGLGMIMVLAYWMFEHFGALRPEEIAANTAPVNL